MSITVSCIVCKQSSHFVNYERAQENGYINYNGAWFCSQSCLDKFLAKHNGSGNGSGSSDGASSDGDSSGSTGGDALGAGIGLAAAGAGAALAGVGAAAKGIGSLIGGIGKGAGAMGDLMKDGVNQSKMNTKIAQEMMDYKFSDNPETYKKEIADMYATAMMKASFPPNPLEWSKQTYAKKRLCKEFESMARTNPAMYADYAQQYEILKKKRSAWTNFIIGAGVFLIVFCVLLPMITVSASSGKSKKETARLEAIVKEIDDAIAAKDYDTALYKATKLQWTQSPGAHNPNWNNWESRREELTATIEKLSGKSAEKPTE